MHLFPHSTNLREIRGIKTQRSVRALSRWYFTMSGLQEATEVKIRRSRLIWVSQKLLHQFSSLITTLVATGRIFLVAAEFGCEMTQLTSLKL